MPSTNKHSTNKYSRSTLSSLSTTDYGLHAQSPRLELQIRKKRYHSKESGAVMVEYATGIALIAMVSFAILVSLTARVQSSDTAISTSVSGPFGGYPPFLIQPQ